VISSPVFSVNVTLIVFFFVSVSSLLLLSLVALLLLKLLLKLLLLKLKSSSIQKVFFAGVGVVAHPTEEEGDVIHDE
jgi:hypothetical protein